ncbi:DUF998 domain-containing protein [Chitinophaga pendula]|uniref:DUF998 domain-containing protein n=1 Tax=Chitinophaga TaxID=79328 RepID=UPI000BAFB711|nr:MULTISPECIES: DUF998 domain-containing protein [Chitinophaga]ASZ14182.1 hypothetical protein CK934_26140 [Chitinophaga sp. MD30]UCJ08182.1 DUF998 domain-containing protein [Chitinophaga pendula]
MDIFVMMIIVPAILAILGLVTGIVYFGARQRGYYPLRHTISELGAQGVPDASRINYGLFLPAGLLLGVVAILSSGHPLQQGIAGGLGFGYTVSALWPCDAGAPLWGSWRQQLHTLGGTAGYAWAIGVLFYYGTFPLLYSFILFCMLLTAIPQFMLRGLAQRIAEGLLFACMLRELM